MYELRHVRPALLGVALVLAGCVDGGRTAPPVTKIEPQKQREAAVVRLLEKCPLSDQAPDAAPALLPLIAAGAVALAPVVIDFAVSALRDYLDRVQKEHTANYMATGAGDIGKKDGFCLVVARGLVGEAADGSLADQGSLKPHHMQTVGLAAPPAFYMEARLEIAKRKAPEASVAAPAAGQGQATPPKPGEQPKAPEQPKPAEAKVVADLVLTPQYLQFARTAAERGQHDEKTVAMVLVLRASPAPENATSATAATDADAVFPLNFGKIKPGVEIMPTTFTAGAPKVDHPLGDLMRTAPLKQLPGSLNVYAFVTESAEPEKVLALMTKALENKGSDLEKALTTAIQNAIPGAAAPADKK
jgi:hypothetical protein